MPLVMKLYRLIRWLSGKPRLPEELPYRVTKPDIFWAITGTLLFGVWMVVMLPLSFGAAYLLCVGIQELLSN